MDYTLREAEFISGIRAPLLVSRIRADELNGRKTGGRWYIAHGSLIDLMYYEWERGRIYMNPPQIWQERVDFVTHTRAPAQPGISAHYKAQQ